MIFIPKIVQLIYGSFSSLISSLKSQGSSSIHNVVEMWNSVPNWTWTWHL